MAHKGHRIYDPDLKLAGPALANAAKTAANEARRTGTKLAVWQDGRVVLLTPDEFEGKTPAVREQTKDDYGKTGQ